VIDVARRSVNRHGEMREVMGSLEWKTVGRVNQLSITVNSTEEGVSVRIFDDVAGIAALTWVASMAAGLVSGGLIVNSLQPDSIVVEASILGAGATAGFGVARAIWSATTKLLRRRAERLREEITAHLLR
jgi:hypothetical protein